MAITDAKKVDYLWKKIGYGVTKTDTNANKKAPNESIASPLLLRGDKTWNQADEIPTILPVSSTGVVTVYPTSAPTECTVDNTTVEANRTWKAVLTDWIPPEFGSTYQAKVYIHTAGDAANAASGGTQVFATGSGNNDEWFFDYQSGVLHFIGANLPNGVDFTGKVLYISGGRYSGSIGLQNLLSQEDPTANFTFTGSTINQDVTDADFTMDTAGNGQFVFNSTTAINLPAGNTAQRPSATAGMLRFNSQTGKYEVSEDGATYTTLRTSSEAGNITKDVFTGDGSTTEFTMSITPTDEKNIILYVDGVMQEPNTNYTITGVKLSFTGGDSVIEAPHEGARIVIMHGFAD
jgi:hypothetical protein